ncbi:DNA repair protein RecN [alpha proteobacterium Q-1]|nr:DNA repair protein RecN [alpha proteobacterium Q-1]
MLLSLVIRDIVLIEHLELGFNEGLTVLTGETGAGKSILLDSLGLAIGARAETSLVRQGAKRGSVTASFAVPASHPARRYLDDQDFILEDDLLILRRVINADGGSRAFVNDQPSSVAVLRALGDLLIEVHGQHDDRGLLDAAGHRDLLDAFGGHGAVLKAVAASYDALSRAEAALSEAEAQHAALRADEDFMRHALAELQALAPEPGEEERLAMARAQMMQGEKLAVLLAEIREELSADSGFEAQLRGALRRLERLDVEAQALLEPVLTPLNRAALEAAEGMAALGRVEADLDFDPHWLEQTEERLFALRAAGRKHKCPPDDLPDLQKRMAAAIASLDDNEHDLADRRRALDAARAAFADQVAALHAARREAAARLDQAVMAELPPLKLEKARFQTEITALAQDHWVRHGGDHVAFAISTNPGAPFGPLIKIASGGELARFILALKVALASRMSADSLVFDEVDRGIGGATADAVGERLARLAARAQVLVVTHSPQVAARGDTHFQISKSEIRESLAGTTDDGQMRTDVLALDPESRREEIARMLSGAAITDEARAAASSLMKRSA